MFSRVNTLSVGLEYSNDSSHIILGIARQRRLLGVEASYERRLVHAHNADIFYSAEIRPLVLWFDPLAKFVETLTTPPLGVVSVSSSLVQECVAGTYPFSYVDPVTGDKTIGEVTTTCSKRLTYSQGASPIGVRVSFRTQKPWQFTLASRGGYMFSTRPIPSDQAGSFNFTFEFGGGLEYFRDHGRSMRLEYVVQHYSNYYTAPENPGVDSGIFKLSYAFGR